MGLFDKIKEPIFLKETSSAKKQLLQLENLLNCASENQKSAIEDEIKFVKAGIYGEDQIAFELKNSHIPMLILHDLFLQSGELTAQIDYLVVTRYGIFVLECKNLIGNIEINSNGDFIRTFKLGTKNIREGIYSPITQNRRHMELIKELRSKTKGNPITKAIFNDEFYKNYRSIVVLANPKTILNDRYAKKEIKQQVIRCDQLIEYIKHENENISIMSEKRMEEIGNYFLNLHQEIEIDYTEKYHLTNDKNINTKIDNENKTAKVVPVEDDKQNSSKKIPVCPKCGAKMILRKANKGMYTGNEFWGCEKYPKCRGIINISDKLNERNKT
ncbi:MAG: NERD domain-containing protein [Lachnospiraceae bacterium]|nr:NERD domain-containing protein [Lachnospiraceae bacterium]